MKTYRDITGNFPYGGVKARISFFDDSVKPCEEKDATTAVVTFYDINGEVCGSQLLGSEKANPYEKMSEGWQI